MDDILMFSTSDYTWLCKNIADLKSKGYDMIGQVTFTTIIHPTHGVINYAHCTMFKEN